MKAHVVASLLAVGLVAACSPKNVGGVDAGGEGGTSADQACADLEYARCTRLQECSPTALTFRYGDLTTCETVNKAYCVANLAAPSTGQTVANVEACAQQYPNWDCNDYVLTQNPPPECQQVDGSLANGTSCAFPAQCQSGFCAIVPGAACGVCAATPQPGDSCAQLTLCGQSIICSTDSATCYVPPAAGAACSYGQTCVTGYECIGATSAGAAGTCVAGATSAGAACDTPTTACSFYAGFTCDTQTKQCVAVSFSGSGQGCNFDSSTGVDEQCSGGAKCVATSSTAPGTCSAVSSIGGACDLVAGPACVGPSRCVVAADGGTGGTCQVPDGTACN